MSTLEALLARPAPSDPDGEAGDDRPGVTQLAGELLGFPLEDHPTAVVGAVRGHRCSELPVDRPHRYASMTVTSVVLPRTATRTSRLRCRVTLGERCRLAFPRTPSVLQ